MAPRDSERAGTDRLLVDICQCLSIKRSPVAETRKLSSGGLVCLSGLRSPLVPSQEASRLGHLPAPDDVRPESKLLRLGLILQRGLAASIFVRLCPLPTA